jgi:Arc/MetJ-type ribon-helix-helix transcriptional regulator
MIRFGYVQNGVQRFAEWTEESGLVCEDDLLDAVNLLIGAKAPVKCSWVGYLMEASVDTPVQAWGTINKALKWCNGVELVRCTPPLIEYDEFSEPEEDLLEKATFSSRSEAGRYAAQQRWKNHAKQETLLTPTDDVSLAQKTGQPITWLLPATRDMRLKGLLSSLAPHFIATGVSVQDFDSVLGDPAIKPLIKYLEDKGIVDIPDFYSSEGATNAELVAHGLIVSAMQDLALKMRSSSLDVDRSKSFNQAIQIATDGFPTVNMGITAFEMMMDEGGRYKTQFEAGDSGGYFSPDLRAAFESSVLGLHPDMDATKRPVYGTMQTSTSLKTSEDAQMYGGIVLQLKNNVRDRTTVAYNDSLGMATRTAPANSVKDDSGGMFRTGMITEPFFYVEAQIHGGVNMDDVDAVWIHNFTGVDAEAPRRVREALDANGYTDVPVLRVGVDEPVEKAKFSSRSEAGRYAAHIRWMNERGMTPMTADQWNAQNSGGSERMRKIKSMQADVSKRLKNLNDVLVKSGLASEGMWNQGRLDSNGDLKYVVVDPKDWDKTSVPEVSKSPMAAWLVEVDIKNPESPFATYQVPNAEVMALMEDVKTLGSLIEEEVQERINAQNIRLATGAEASRDFTLKIVNAQRVITHYETITSRFLNDFITFKADPNDPTPKFQQYVKSGQPKMIGSLVDYAPSLGEFIESNNSADEKVLLSALIEKTRSSVLELNQLGFEQNTSAKYRREVLAEIRSFGADEGTPYEIVTGFNFPNGAPVEVRIADAMQNLPTAWIDNLKTYTQTKTTHRVLRAKTVNEMQSGYIEANHIIQTSANAQTAFVIHELVHAVEASSPVMRAMVHSFGVNRRVGNFRPSEEKFGSTFAQRLQTGIWEESGRSGFVEDSYFDKYSGRVYGGFAYSAHEQLTTGTDYSLFVNTIRPHDRIDSDQLTFTLGMWASA